MKPATKKTIIIIVAVLIVALIVWLVLRSRETVKRIIDKLDFSKYEYTNGYSELRLKSAILAEVETVKTKWTNKEISEKADEDKISYNKELVQLAAYRLLVDGTINQDLYNDLCLQLRRM